MGKIFNIQRFCVDDGPGIRTVVFLSGCPLKCQWCHNPESWNVNGSLFYYPEKCVSCGQCAAICSCHTFEDGVHKIDRSKCTLCGKCAEIGCGALKLSVKDYTAQEAMDVVLKDKRFYDGSGGGVTFSGGEPLLQYDFLVDMMKIAKENGLHVCLETCGFYDTEKLLALTEYVDIFLYDYKMTDEQKHLEYTGVSNKLILKNLEALNDAGAKIVLRCVLIPTVNDNDEHFEAIGRIADKYDGITAVNIEPYHELGNSKRAGIGKDATFEDIEIPNKEVVKSYLDRIHTKKPCTN